MVPGNAFLPRGSGRPRPLRSLPFLIPHRSHAVHPCFFLVGDAGDDGPGAAASRQHPPLSLVEFDFLVKILPNAQAVTTAAHCGTGARFEGAEECSVASCTCMAAVTSPACHALVLGRGCLAYTSFCS